MRLGLVVLAEGAERPTEERRERRQQPALAVLGEEVAEPAQMTGRCLVVAR